VHKPNRSQPCSSACILVPAASLICIKRKPDLVALRSGPLLPRWLGGWFSPARRTNSAVTGRFLFAVALVEKAKTTPAGPRKGRGRAGERRGEHPGRSIQNRWMCIPSQSLGIALGQERSDTRRRLNRKVGKGRCRTIDPKTSLPRTDGQLCQATPGP
jgi:hypothetical protein